jgi:hypothetical protein
MDELRRHHAQTVEIHHRTQPMIDDQIHEDTLKYLKTAPANGTKARSQKPRAPKRQRSTASNINTSHTSITPNLSNNSNCLNQSQVQTLTKATGPINSLQHHSINSTQQQQQQQQQQHPPQQHQQPPQQQHPRTNGPLLSQPRHIIQQQTQPQMSMSLGPIQHMPAFSPNMQQSIHVQPQRANQMHQHQSYNDNYQNRYQTQPVYQQQQHMQPMSHGSSRTQVIDQGHNHYINIHSNTFAHQNHQSFYPTQHISNNIAGHHHTTLPNDLDLNIQAGLECDIESLIKHEMSVEGQLDFNPDLLVKLDNYYQPNYQ